MKKKLFYLLIFAFLLGFHVSAQQGTNSATHAIQMESITPNVFVRNMNETVSFYRTLGFEIVMKVPESGNYDWVMMKNGNISFMFQTFSSVGDSLPLISRKDGGSLLLYIQIKNIRSFFENIKDKVTIIGKLEKTFYGATEFSIKDTNGYMLTFAEEEK